MYILRVYLMSYMHEHLRKENITIKSKVISIPFCHRTVCSNILEMT